MFSASNVELITKTRTEHLTDQDKQRCKKSSSKTPLESFLGMAEQEEKTQGAANGVREKEVITLGLDIEQRSMQ